MGLNCGILGLPNVGKSTIFSALTSAKAEIANYPFCTIDPNVGIVTLPDPRLKKLSEIYKPKKLTPTTVEFVDIAGLVKGASKGEGLGNAFLGHVREVDALLHVVRCFEDPEIVYPEGEINPRRDIETIDTELILADMDVLERRIGKIEKKAKSGGKDELEEMNLILELRDILNSGKPLRAVSSLKDQREDLAGYRLLTLKPMLYVANISEYHSEKEKGYLRAVEEKAQGEGVHMVVLSGKLESEMVSLPEKDRKIFLEELGLGEPGLDRLIHSAYQLLHLFTFFTAGEEEVRAWTITEGTKAPQAAGKIHSDMEKGFIRAEVMRYEDLMRYGSVGAVKEKGLLKIEGRDYYIRDGDVIYFRFNV